MMEDGWHGKDVMEIKGKKEKDRKRKPVTEQMEAAEMARERAKQTKMRRSSGAYNTVVSALVKYC